MTVGFFTTAAGEAYIDDVALVPQSGPNAGINLVTNGNFESPLSVGPWLVNSNYSASIVTNTYAHSGNYSLHVVGTSAGNQNINIRQIFPILATNTIYTLSFWYHTLNNVKATVRTPMLFATSIAQSTLGELPLVEIPIATSFRLPKASS